MEASKVERDALQMQLDEEARRIKGKEEEMKQIEALCKEEL